MFRAAAAVDGEENPKKTDAEMSIQYLPWKAISIPEPRATIISSMTKTASNGFII